MVEEMVQVKLLMLTLIRQALFSEISYVLAPECVIRVSRNSSC